MMKTRFADKEFHKVSVNEIIWNRKDLETTRTKFYQIFTDSHFNFCFLVLLIQKISKKIYLASLERSKRVKWAERILTVMVIHINQSGSAYIFILI